MFCKAGAYINRDVDAEVECVGLQVGDLGNHAGNLAFFVEAFDADPVFLLELGVVGGEVQRVELVLECLFVVVIVVVAVLGQLHLLWEGVGVRARRILLLVRVRRV